MLLMLLTQAFLRTVVATINDPPVLCNLSQLSLILTVSSLKRREASSGTTTNMADEANIWTAAGDGLLDKVQEFVRSGISVDAQDENGYTPL